MLTVRECSNLLSVSPMRIKQIIQENGWKISRSGKHKVSKIKVPSETVRNLLDHRGLKYNNPKVITIAAEKGGVGKTFLSTNVAVMAAARGLKVCLIDIDPESCSTNSLLPDNADYDDMKTMLEVFNNNIDFNDVVIPSKYENLYLIPCKPKARRVERTTADRNPKKLISEKIASLKENFDLILFDLPPNFSTLTASCYLACELVIMPSFPNVYSLESVELTMADIEEVAAEYDAEKPETKILLNAFRSTEKASREVRHALESDFKEHLLPFEISKYQDVSNLINEGLSVLEASSKALPDLMALTDFILPLQEKTDDKKVIH